MIADPKDLMNSKLLVEKNYFPSLTGLRMIAASMVFLHHFNPFTPRIFGNFIHAFVGEFHVGVTIFFVLSGFLICMRYFDKVQPNKKSIRLYLVNRFARIYPMYFIMTLVAFAPFVCHCNLKYEWKLLLLNLSFARGFFDEYKFTGVATGWSLTVEEMFYFLFPFIIFLKRKIYMWLQLIIIVFFGLLLWLMFKNFSFHGFFVSFKFIFEFTFLGRCFEFFTGMYLALYLKNKLFTAAPTKIQKTLSGLLYIAVCVTLLAINSQNSANAGLFLFIETCINNVILPPGIALLLYGLLSEKNLLSRCLESHLFILLGKSSYCFYLIHNGFLFGFFYLTLGLNIFLIFVLLQLISVLLYITVESPLSILIKKISHK